MPALAIDLGKKFCGFAVEIAGISFPKNIVEAEHVISETEKLVAQYGVDVIVVGIAPNMDGSNSKQANVQRNFAKGLEKIFPFCKIVLINEAFSSKQARFEHDTYLRANNLSVHGNQPDRIDDMAAAIILEAYLSQI